MDSQIDPISDKQDCVADLLPSLRALVRAPVGAAPEHVRAWSDNAVEASEPVVDGTLASERDAADTYRRMAKADNKPPRLPRRRLGWCAWCAKHDLPPLPASGQDVAAFLEGERGRKHSPKTLKLRRAAIHYLHRAAGCPVPSDDVCISETLAGVPCETAKKGQVPRKKVADTATILLRLLAPIAHDFWGLRYRAILLVGFARLGHTSAPFCVAFIAPEQNRLNAALNQSFPPFCQIEECPVLFFEGSRSSDLASGIVLLSSFLRLSQKACPPPFSPGRLSDCPAPKRRGSRLRRTTVVDFLVWFGALTAPCAPSNSHN